MDQGEDEGDVSPGISRDVWVIILISLAILSAGIAGSMIGFPVHIPDLHADTYNESTLITILHRGGDPVWPGGFQILVDGVDQTANFTNSGDWPWSIGETLSYNASSMPRSAIMLYNWHGRNVILVQPRVGHPPYPSFAVPPSTAMVSVQNTTTTTVPEATRKRHEKVEFEIQGLRRTNPETDNKVAILTWYPYYTGEDDRITWEIWLAPFYLSSDREQYIDSFQVDRGVNPVYPLVLSSYQPGTYRVRVKGHVSDATDRNATLMINIPEPYPKYEIPPYR